jgi:diguanylate cyclase (GGDEF)-like protein/PAS domain S-box-containing protein
MTEADKRNGRETRATAEHRLRAVLDNAPLILWVLDRDGRFVVSEGRGLRDIPLAPGEVVGRSVFDVYAGVPAVLADTRRVLAGESFVTTGEVGGRVYQVHYEPLYDAAGEVDGAQGVALDITEHRRVELERVASEEQYRCLVETVNDVIWAVNAVGRMTFVNDAARRVFGHELHEFTGRPFSDFIAPEQHAEAARAFGHLLSGVPVQRFELDGLRADGSRIPLSINAVAVRDPDGTVIGATGTTADVTAQRHYERELRHMADHDALTGLFNRRRFEEELARESAIAARHVRGGAVLVLDLDNFKFVNDTLGHGVGDDVLRGVGAVLQRRLRASDVVARIGGDEFALLLAGADADIAAAVGREILGILRDRPLAVAGHSVRVTASAGLSTLGGRGESATAILGEADLAMYAAKESGRDRIAVYSEARHARHQEHQTWADRIRVALESDAFVLLAQPIVDTRTGAVVHQELLLRMRADDGGLVPPGAFLPTAERFGLMPRIDRWVLSRAIGLVAEAPAAPRFAVNLSARSLDDRSLARFIAEELDHRGVAADRLVLEVTETAAMANMQDARRLATALRELGCGLALDDFGTGFASFHYLKQMPFRSVKIAGEFVRDIERSPENRLLVEAIVRVAHGMGLETVAEEVDTEDALATIAELGVDLAQGYHLGRPAPLERLVA